MGVERGTLPPWILRFDIFLIHFYQNQVVFLVSSGKNEISPFTAPWENLFGYLWKNPLLVPSAKNPSDVHSLE